MKEQDFIILSEIFKTKNISKAAENLFLTQPTLSYHLKQIERKLDIKIFRDSNKFILSEEGELLVKFSTEKIREFTELRSNLQNIKNDKIGIINIGVSSNFALYKLPQLLLKFYEKHPYVRATINTGWSHQILKGLNDKELQVGIITGDYEWYGEKILISKDPLTIINSEPFNVKDLPHLSRINYRPKSNSNEMNLPLKPIESQIQNWWESNFLTNSDIVMNIDTVETCKIMVQYGLGFSIIPSSSLSKNDKFYTHQLTDQNNNLITRKTYMLYNASYKHAKTIYNFIDFIKEYDF